MTDLHFIETSNRWISETQVKIKSEVAANNQQAQQFKKLVLAYRDQLDSIINPHLDKKVGMIFFEEKIEELSSSSLRH